MARIFDIKHFAVHDGPGIRTTVFFKGCPLRCLWCHNPESISPQFQLSCHRTKCTQCGRCVDVCEQGVHILEQGHRLLREKCTFCGKCEKVCLTGALTLYGREVSVDEILPELLEDQDFYGESGGVTLSGGECLMQADFCAELLRRLKEKGIHTAIDTCGFVKREALEKVLADTDIFLYDLKAFDEEVHIRCTGQSNRIILENLKYLDAQKKRIEIRIPYVPGYNSDQMEKIAGFLKTLSNIEAIKVLPYHKYAGSKYDALAMECTLPDRVPVKEEIEQARDILKSSGIKLV